MSHPALRDALATAAQAGLIVCAAAAQSGVDIAGRIEDFGEFVEDALGEPIDGAAATASDAAVAAQLTAMMAKLTRLALTPRSTSDGLVAEVVSKAEAAGRTAS